MTMDLDERARRAGIELRLLADERAASMRPPGAGTTSPGRRPLILTAAAAVVVGLIVAVGLVLDGGPVTLEIDPVGPGVPDAPVEQPPAPIANEDGWLPVPEIGEATAAYREDFTPVFISHPADGEVLVLDAIDPHRAYDLDDLAGFCRSSGWFEAFHSGSRWNAWGDWTGGPAPSGLAAYPIELNADGAQVRITGELQPAPARDAQRGEDQAPIGPACFDLADEPADLVAHRPPPSPPTLTADEIPAERWVWATLVLGGEADDVRVCDPDGTCRPDAPQVTFSTWQPGTQVERAPVAYLARLETDGRIRILHTADPTDGSFRQLTNNGDQSLLSVPEPGTATPVALRDNTPAFATHTDDGDIQLLAAWSPENPAQLLGWCPTDQSLHGPTGRYAPDGRHLDGTGQDLVAYGIEIEAVGNDRGIRITTRPDVTEDPSTRSPDTEAEADPSCGTELVSHRPTTADHVYDEPDGIQLSGERWVWVRMPVQERDGELYLCSLANAVPDCGVPHPEHTNCQGENPNPATCPPLQDPIITTPGIDPDDQPRLLLVRANTDGTNTQIRIPDDNR
jgi:hypothetical protein